LDNRRRLFKAMQTGDKLTPANSERTGTHKLVGANARGASCCWPRPARYSQAQELGVGLGAQNGKFRLRKIVSGGSFTRLPRAASTPTWCAKRGRKPKIVARSD
jgi:hypothetical protein